MGKLKIIAVIPAYNEEKYVSSVIKGAKKYVNEIIVVDDCSKDNTADVAKLAGATSIRLAANSGVGFATRLGCDKAYNTGADIIVTLDADGQHSPHDIPLLVDELVSKKKDIVFGSRRRNKEMPLKKRIGNAGLTVIAQLLFNVNVSDSQTGFHAFTRDAYKKLRWTSDRYGVVSEFIMRVAKNKLKYSEVPVQTIYNKDKYAGMGFRDAIKSVLYMLKWRFLLK